MAALTIPRFATRRVARLSAIAGAIGLIGTVIAIAIDPQRALLGYLAAYITVFGIAGGALVLLLIGHAANTRWLSAPRRIVEAVAGLFPVLGVLFLPIAFGLRWIYPWTDPAALSAHDRAVVATKQAWLDPAAFITRGFAYLVVLGFAAEVLRRWSRDRDGAQSTGDPEHALIRERRFASAMLPPVGLAITFAAFDWVMSLQPTWSSTMFGVYCWAGGFVAAIAVISMLGARLVHRAPEALTGHHFHALGRMLLAFVVFWAYTAYFQGFLIQIADRPSEVTFYIARTRDGWYGVLWAILLARFALPFLFLLPRAPKHYPGYVAAISACVVAGHILETYWLVLPSAGGPFAPSLADLATYVFVIGSCVAVGAWRQHDVPTAATGDPFLAAGRRYESPT